MGKTHDRKADALARIFGTEHNRKGVDIKTRDKAIEVAVKNDDIKKSIKQLNMSRKPKKYLAVPPKKVNFAKKVTQNTGIGVMSTTSNIRKRARN